MNQSQPPPASTGRRPLRRILRNWLQRHRHPFNFWIHLLGIPLAEPMMPVFACLADFQSLRALYTQMVDLIDRIARAPGGEALRQHLQIKTDNGTEHFACAELDMALQKLAAAEPYCSFCPRCHALRLNCFITDCHSCRGRGWTTRAAFEACSENSRRDMLKTLAAPAKTG